MSEPLIEKNPIILAIMQKQKPLPYSLMSLKLDENAKAQAYNQALIECAEIVQKAPTVEPASPWHRVEEELPPVGKFVLCYYSRSKLYEVLALLLVTEDGDSVWQDDTHCWNFSNGVTHWTPLPEPPKEG